MEAVICSMFLYTIISVVVALIFAETTVTGDFFHVVVFWPLLFIKWSLKSLWNILFKGWRD